jgi:hypothetical protein
VIQKGMIEDFLTAFKAHRKPLKLLAATWGVYFIALFSRILVMKADGIYSGHVNVWSDWSLHIGMVNIFAYKSPHDWFAYHPLYGEGHFTYPFLTNLLSGLLVRSGWSLVSAMTIPSIVYSFALLTGWYFFFYMLLRSRRQAVLVIFLFLFSSGPGFLRYVQELISHFSWASVLYPPDDYTRIDERQWYGGNVIEGLLAPQRAFLLGMTIAIWGLCATFRGLEVWGTNRALCKKYWVLAGVLIGLLPFTHAHSLIAIAPGLTLVFLYCVIRNPKVWRDLLYLEVPSVLLVLADYVFFLRGGIQVEHFQSWAPGWTSQGGFLSWMMLWLRVWGIAIPLALFAFARWAWKKDSASVTAKLFVGSYFLLFGLGNLVFFQPIAWDNSKIFFWCYLFFCVPLAVLLDELARSSSANASTSKKKWAVAAAAMLFLALTATGMMETYRIQWTGRNENQMTNMDNIQLGEKIRRTTGPRDMFLTAAEHNQFVMMWGARPILLGFTPWVLNYGFNYQQVEQDLKAMYLGGADLEPLLRKHQIHYVVIGRAEREVFHANEMLFARNYPLAFSDPDYEVYDVTSKRP